MSFIVSNTPGYKLLGKDDRKILKAYRKAFMRKRSWFDSNLAQQI